MQSTNSGERKVKLKSQFKYLVLGVAFMFAFDVSAQHGTKGGSKATPFINKANMDLKVKPGDDFYTYANGVWLSKNPVPAKETRWGSFNQLRDFNIKAVRTILTESAAKTNAKAGTIEKRVGDFYAAGMDSTAIDKLGYTPIKADLVRIAALKDVNAVLNEVAYLAHRRYGNPVFKRNTFYS